MRRAAILAFYDEEKKLLLQLRTDDAPVLPSYWSFFGGRIEDGETPEQAIIREIKEEINYDLRNPKFLFKKYLFLNEDYEENVFLEKCDDKTHLKLGEGADWGWFLIDEALKLKMIDSDKQLLEEIRKEIQ